MFNKAEAQPRSPVQVPMQRAAFSFRGIYEAQVGSEARSASHKTTDPLPIERMLTDQKSTNLRPMPNMRTRGTLPSFSYTPCWFGGYVGFQGQISYILLQAHLSFAEFWCYKIQGLTEYRLLCG
jgi:hypothetical protein